MRAPRRRNRSIETGLQAEVTLRLRINYPWIVVAALPNGVWLPASTDAERVMAARLIKRMKATGMLTEGAGDLALMAKSRGCYIELKRPRSKDLLGNVTAAGVLSPDQRAFRDRCAECDVPFYVCHSWADVDAAVQEVWA